MWVFSDVMKGHPEHVCEDIGEEHEEEPWYKGPIKIILGVFLILLLLLWLVPHYGIKQNPEPSYTPLLEEMNIPKLTVPETDSNNIRSYIYTTSDIKQIADIVVTLSCTETHLVCNAKAIFYFVQKNFKYVNDPLFYEHYKTPQETLTTTALDCDDASILLSSFLRAIGFQTRFVFVPKHVYVQVRIPEAISAYKEDGDWINLDATCQNCKFGEIHYKYAKAEKRYLE